MTARATFASLRPSNRGALLLSAAFALCGPGAVHAGPPSVIVDNGTVALGVDPFACLNVPIAINNSLTGLFDIATGLDGTRSGLPYEGWGIADLNYPLGGGAVSLVSGTYPPQNLTLADWGVSGSGTLGASAGQSVFTLHSLNIPVAGPGRGGSALLFIRHDFHPSANSHLYEIEVTVTNNSVGAVRPRYRRLVDWDTEPTPFTEWVTIEHGPSTAVVDSVGYFPGSPVDPNPLTPLPTLALPAPARSPQAEGFNPCPVNASFVDCGPGDQASAIDFEFPAIPPGGTMKFWLYYGTAPDETTALAALDEVGASAYSLGQSTASPSTTGSPVTFIFGFKAPWAIVDNGAVELGIDMFGALNVWGGTPSAGSIGAPTRGLGPNITGLREVGTNFESLAGGTPWEGWGLNVDLALPLAGTVSLVASEIPVGPVDSRGPSYPDPAHGYGMSPLDFDVLGTGTLEESVGRRAIVRTAAGVAGDPPLFHVTHDFKPSKVPGLYEVVVILENVSGVDLPPTLYRRIADWDIEPTATDEYVSNLFDSPAVFESVDTGFNSPIPYTYMTPVLCDAGEFFQCGPADLGMGYSFVIDAIPAGGREQFLLYYGSGPDAKTLYDTLLGLGVGAMSIAEPNLFAAPIPEALTPVVFGFGFKDVLFVDDFETGDSTRWSTTTPAP